MDHSTQELNSIIKKSITGQWQLSWENSIKGRILHKIQPTVNRKKPLQLNLSPTEQRITNRLRTGKTTLKICQGPNRKKRRHGPQQKKERKEGMDLNKKGEKKKKREKVKKA
ncbi:hypothetical protein CHS0354_039155 [Potamilus streckersoni]|uniref:Uncharacterized protein n=1 Tax=Potamilus streckersoni TaxID=2493646 RepID=A0AAE0S7A8_9BIVA|nr:hypothetical protein CHS0354_039155 [Potamilus streckersoni]